MQLLANQAFQSSFIPPRPIQPNKVGESASGATIPELLITAQQDRSVASPNPRFQQQELTMPFHKTTTGPTFTTATNQDSLSSSTLCSELDSDHSGSLCLTIDQRVQLCKIPFNL